MADEGRSTQSIFWPILLIGAGIAFLLINLDLIPRPNLSAVLRLWPLFFVGVGLNLILRGRYPRVSSLIAIGAVAIAAALLVLAPSLGIGADTELSTERFSEPVGGASSARISLDLARYGTTVDGLAGSSTLIAAELDTLGSIDFKVSGTSDKSINLRERAETGFSFTLPNLLNELASDTGWEIHLNPDLPLDLNVDVASGSAILNLDNLTLTGLVVDGGSGSTAVTLPAAISRYDAFFDSGSGSFAVSIANGAEVDAEIDGGSGSFTLSIGDAVDISLEIDGGSGRTRIEVPRQADIRLVIRDGGSGSVSFPRRFDLTDDLGDNDSDTGIWETAGFDDAVRKIEIVFDPGSGSFAVD